MYLVYSALLAGGLILGSPYWIFQMLRHGKYRAGLGERLGGIPARLRRADDGRPVAWIHAVSVGEVAAVGPLVRMWQRAAPHWRLVISTTTQTGQALARKQFGDDVFYCPLDFAFAVRKYLAFLKPALVVLAETEFWPNFLRESHRAGARIAVVNGRISDRSLPGYRRFRRLIRSILEPVDLFLAQTTQDSERLASIGAKPERIAVSGNLKFDMPASPPPPIVGALREAMQRCSAGPALVCGSTMEGEESLLIHAFQSILASFPRTVMLLAPRHPERFERVAGLLQELNVPFSRRSLWSGEPLAGTVMLVDTIGELAAMYALADVAFVGGSLVERGGHNILEPAQHGVAIVTGNHYENFRDIVWQFQQANAVRIVGPAELPLALLELMQNSELRRAMGMAARETLRAQQGATARTLEALGRLAGERWEKPQDAVSQGTRG